MKKITTSLIILLSLASNAHAFSDLSPGHPYSEAAYFLKDIGVLEGFADGAVKLDQPITRSEFLKMVLVYNQEEIGELTGCFPDTEGHWSENIVCYAESKGWVSGYANGSFKPEQNVNYAEALKMISEVVFPYYDYTAVGGPEDWFYVYADTLDDKGVDVCEVNTYDEIISRGVMAQLLFQVETSEQPARHCMDVKGVEDLGMSVFKYRGSAYFNAYRIYGEDLETFERINEHYSRDKDHVFVRDEIVEGADPDTFELLHYVYIADRAYGRDKDKVYYGNAAMDEIDRDTIVIVSDEFFLDKNGIYFQENWGDGNTYKKIPSADPDTFGTYDNWHGYSYDANNIYFGTTKIKSADRETFEVLGSTSSGLSNTGLYAKDKNNVYCGIYDFSEYGQFRTIEEADAATFEFVPGEKWQQAQDANNIYEDCEIVEKI